MWFDLGASVRVEEANFLVKPTNNWSGGESTAFIMYHSDDPASNGQTTWLQGWTVTAAGDSGNNAAWITFKNWWSYEKILVSNEWFWFSW